MGSTWLSRIAGPGLGAGLLLVACDRASPPADAAATPALAAPARSAPAAGEATLRAADSALQHAIRARDLERTIAFYAPDAVLLPAAKPGLAGRDAIRREWTMLFAIPGFQNASALRAAEVAAAGDLAYTRGTYEATLTGHQGETLMEPGKWVSIWRRQPDGTWRIVVDIYNTDVPPPDHQ